MCASFSTSGPSPSTKKKREKTFLALDPKLADVWTLKRQETEVGGLIWRNRVVSVWVVFLCAYPKDGDKRAHMFHGFNFKHTHTHTRTVAVHMGKKATSSIKLIFVYWISFLFMPLHYSLYINVLRQSFITWNISTLRYCTKFHFSFITVQSFIHFWHGDILSLSYEWSVSTLSLLKPWTGLKSNCSPQWVDVDPHHHLHTWGINV